MKSICSVRLYNHALIRRNLPCAAHLGRCISPERITSDNIAMSGILLCRRERIFLLFICTSSIQRHGGFLGIFRTRFRFPDIRRTYLRPFHRCGVMIIYCMLIHSTFSMWITCRTTEWTSNVLVILALAHIWIRNVIFENADLSPAIVLKSIIGFSKVCLDSNWKCRVSNMRFRIRAWEIRSFFNIFILR